VTHMAPGLRKRNRDEIVKYCVVLLSIVTIAGPTASAQGARDVRAELEKAYKENVDAYMRGDIRAVMALRAPDSHAVARRHRAGKRGGGLAPLTLDDAAFVTAERAEILVELDEALVRLTEIDERLSRVVECRFFGGLTEEETAEALAVTARTVRRDWVKAKAWLHEELQLART
jgi:RNA polymerase sigma factor (sigma-70 family)